MKEEGRRQLVSDSVSEFHLIVSDSEQILLWIENGESVEKMGGGKGRGRKDQRNKSRKGALRVEEKEGKVGGVEMEKRRTLLRSKGEKHERGGMERGALYVECVE